MVSRRHMESRRKIITERKQVRVHSVAAKDEYPEAKPVLAEKRPVQKQDSRSADFGGDATATEWVLWTVELAPVVLKVSDVIEDVAAQEFFAVDSIGEQLKGARLHAKCFPTINPTIGAG